MKKALTVAVLGLTTLLASGAVLAQAKPETLARQRQAAMTLQFKYFAPMAGMELGKVPYNAETVKRNAEFLEVLSKMAWDGFHANTKELKNRATPAVFSDPAKFKEEQDSFQAEAAKLAAVSKGGTEAAVKAQIGAVRKTCDSCHETFRENR